MGEGFIGFRFGERRRGCERVSGLSGEVAGGGWPREAARRKRL